MKFRYASSALVVVAAWFLASCGSPVVTAGLAGAELGFTDVKVHRQLLPVIATPQSVSHKRLNAYAAMSPRMREHLASQGYPEYVREKIGFGLHREVELLYPARAQRFEFAITHLPTGVKDTLNGPLAFAADDLAYLRSLKEMKRSVE